MENITEICHTVYKRNYHITQQTKFRAYPQKRNHYSKEVQGSGFHNSQDTETTQVFREMNG